MSAVETLMTAVERIYFMPEHFWIKKDYVPGQAYQELPEDMKEKLRELKSDDLKKVRMDLIKDVVLYCQFRAEWARDYRRRRRNDERTKL